MPQAKIKSTQGNKKPAPHPPETRLVWQICIGLALAVVALYWRVLANQFINFDDGPYVVLNEHVKGGLSLDGLLWAFRDVSTGNWHPVTWLSHMCDIEWFGLNPAGHHMASVGIHAVNAAVLLIVLWRMTGHLWRSAFVAALFAFHPLRVESVAWVAERKDVLSGFFYLCTIGAYAWYTKRPESWRRYAVVAALMTLGLMSKPSVVTAPFLLLLLDYWPLARKEPLAVLLREKVPFLALAGMVSAITFVFQKEEGAMKLVDSLAMPGRLANAVVSYVRYLGKMIWPHPLAVIYPFPRSISTPAVAACFLLLAAITAVVLLRGRAQRYLPVGWFWFLGTMVPMIGIVQVGRQAYADRYSYIPSIGICIALVWLAAEAFARWKWRFAAPVAAAAILPALAFTTWSQLPYWHDDLTLFQHTVDSTSANPAAEYNLGQDLVEQGRNREAIPHLDEMIRLQPNFYSAYYMKGKAYVADGDTGAAIRSFTEALRVKPDYAEAYYGRATMLIQSGNNPAAEQDFRAALKYGLSADWAPLAHDGLGVIAGQRGDVAAATAEFEQAVQLRPGLVSANRNLANALVGQGRTREAIARLERALPATQNDPAISQMLEELRAR
jgi:protein O-mannosyl-transferase